MFIYNQCLYFLIKAFKIIKSVCIKIIDVYKCLNYLIINLQKFKILKQILYCF